MRSSALPHGGVVPFPVLLSPAAGDLSSLSTASISFTVASIRFLSPRRSRSKSATVATPNQRQIRSIIGLYAPSRDTPQNNIEHPSWLE